MARELPLNSLRVDHLVPEVLARVEPADESEQLIVRAYGKGQHGVVDQVVEIGRPILRQDRRNHGYQLSVQIENQHDVMIGRIGIEQPEFVRAGRQNNLAL